MTTTVTRLQYFTAVAQLGDMDTLYQALTPNTNDPTWIAFWAAPFVTTGDVLAQFTKAAFGWTDEQMTALFAAAQAVVDPAATPIPT